MTTPTLEPIIAAIRTGETRRARDLLRDELRNRPSADAWYLAARVASTPEQSMEFCRRAIDLDPFHEGASRLLAQVQNLLSRPLATGHRSALYPPQAEPSPLLTDAIVIFGNRDWSMRVSTPEMIQFEKQKGIANGAVFILIAILGFFGSLIAVAAIAGAKTERITLRIAVDGSLTVTSSENSNMYKIYDADALTRIADSVPTGVRSIALVIVLGLIFNWWYVVLL